jgi:hypothetical protein
MSELPISKVCPQCGGTEFKKKKPDRFIAFTWDRVCKACETRYIPPTPVWAAVVFLIIGLILAAGGTISVLLRLGEGKAIGVPAMACEGFLGFLGLLAIGHGIRVLLRPGRV